MSFDARCQDAARIADAAAALALDQFRRLDSLAVELKGQQDFVTEADRATERFIRDELASAFPDDAIVGEEHGDKPGTSGFTWVIDPIDGTANFISGMPFWCVVIAGVADGQIQTAAISDPNHGETFTALRGGGAWLNGAPIHVRADATLTNGTTSVGSSRRSPPSHLSTLLLSIVEAGGVFQRLGSGALGLAYTAAGRYVGYSESHMNAWDCLAGQLLVAEAGGLIEDQNADEMIAQGGRVIAGAPGVFETLERFTTEAFGPGAP